MNRKVLSTIALTGLLCRDRLRSGRREFFWNVGKGPTESESLAQAPAAAAQAPLRLVIEQSPNAVRITRQRLDGQSDTVTSSFNPTRSALPTATTDTPAPAAPRGERRSALMSLRRLATVATDARAEWKDGGLMLLTTLIVSGKAVTTTERLTMSPDSRKLIVETDLMVHHGYESTGGDQRSGATAGPK